ncbi:MAG: hypothetical protein LBE34_11695 [Flavobacteriaceae bacterium]|jgi:hypothetical protein|nr:hypothetical protein [Flavobacteriaceae bacterium]
MKVQPTRFCIYPKDVMLITGKSYSTSLRLLRKIKEVYRKPKEAYVSYVEFCEYTNLDEAEVLATLK